MGDASLPDAVRRRIAYMQDTGSSANVWTVLHRERVSLPIGPAVRISYKQDPAPGLVSRAVEYVHLADGRTLSLTGTAPFDDDQLALLMDDLAQGVVPR